MRTGLDGDPDTAGFGFGDEFDAFRAGDVDDVEVAAGFTREVDGDLNGGKLGLDRAGIEPRAHVGGGGWVRELVPADHFRILGMNGDGESGAGGDFHALAERGGIGGLKFVEAGRAHKSFEADGSGVGHGLHVVKRIGC